MKRQLIEMFWGFIMVILLLAGAVALPLFRFTGITIILFLVLILVWRFTKFIRRKKMEGINIPLEVLEDFNTAERRYQESDGKTEHTEILWDIAKSRRRPINETQQGSGIQTLPKQSLRREDIQNIINSGTPVDKTGNRRIKRNNRKRLFGRK